MLRLGEKIYKVTAAEIGKTRKNFEFYKIQLNNQLWVTKLIPLRNSERNGSELYQLYAENNKSLDFLIGNYISISISKNDYGYEFSSIGSFDVLKDFKSQVDKSNGKVFSTKLPIYDFLVSLNRPVEIDGSIKIFSNYGDMRVSKIKGISVCCQHDTSNEYLNLSNIEQVFEKFYKDVSLPAYDPSEGGANSYYAINMMELGIVKMDNHVKISNKMTTSGDYDKWCSKSVQKIGEKLPEEQIQYLIGLRLAEK